MGSVRIPRIQPWSSLSFSLWPSSQSPSPPRTSTAPSASYIMPPNSNLTAWSTCSLKCLDFSSNSASFTLTSQFIPQIHLPLTFLFPSVEIFSRSPRLENLNPPHPARPQVLLTFPSVAVESVSPSFFFPNYLPWGWCSPPPYWVPISLAPWHPTLCPTYHHSN